MESALVSHPQCAEAAVVGIEHEVCFFKLFSLFIFLFVSDSCTNREVLTNLYVIAE